MRSQRTYVIILGLLMLNCISANAQVVDSSFSRLELIQLSNNKQKAIELNTKITIQLLEGQKYSGRLAIVTLDSIGVPGFNYTSPNPPH